MPELPDVVVYVERLVARFGGQPVENLRVKSPFVIRTFDPPASAVVGRKLASAFRVGKRIALVFEPELYFVVHLMIAGRFHLAPRGKALGKIALLGFDFPEETLLLTEAGTKKRASVHVVATREEALALGRGGIEPLEATLDEFAGALESENHTLKRALTDPRLFSGIGNAYSDEILFWSQLSPMKRTIDLDPETIERLYDTTRRVLTTWVERLRVDAGDGFPEKVTAFRPEMAVHGRYKQPCPVCASPVQRIAYASNEANYCATCQTGGRLLADRALSRLLHGDWPKTLEELEESKAQRAASALPSKPDR
ncbi:MAG: formamidopyrimidine-DNA glycosylase [Myxococcota bacterium]|jgi:formamidopyrimidine-DNA glycosylase|nr:formamidopyrimidine-DNA glycosylase [Myxococcota bacterium]